MTDETFGLTLADALARFEAEGYTAQFGAVEGGVVRCYACHVDTPASEIELDELCRVEGSSDPDDMVAVAAVTCPNCGCKGTIVLKYGPEASLEDSEVLAALADHRPRGTR